jgi:subtilase family serine protease
MKLNRVWAKLPAAALALLVIAPLSALASSEHNIPTGIGVSRYEGHVEASKEMNLTAVLKLHNRAEFDQVVEELYNPASPRYHQWLTDKDFERYAPTAQEYETVKNEFARQGFKIVSEDPTRLTLRVHGTAATIEKAFNTELNNYSYNGHTYQANARDAHLSGPAGDLIDAVAGIERHQSHPKLSYVINPVTGKQATKKLLTTKEDLAAFAASLTDTPLTWSSTPLSLTTPGASLPTAKYTGYQYAANGDTGGFTPAQLQSHYGLPISQGSTTYNGAGQTIALVEGYGYPNAEADANAAVALWNSVDPSLNLPKLTSANFEVIYPEGQPLDPNAGELTGWNVEIALDIQSTHAIAPGAKILVVASSGQDNEDQLASLTHIISKKLANVVSDSWGNDDEILSGQDEETAFSDVLETAISKGISLQFSSGDSGDLGLGTPVGSVGVPANSPYVTAVGGTSVLNNPNATGDESPWIVTGWGNNLVFLYDYGVEDPLEGYYFGGAGGGESQYFPRPAWQDSLPHDLGTGRLVPDVAALADPYTGFALVVTEGTTKYGEVIGGTSLASPVFSAIWAIADEYNGAPLGQAARAVAKLTSASDIADVVPPSSALNTDDVAGSISDSSGKHNYTRTTLYTHAINEDTGEAPVSLYSQGSFLSAIWPIANAKGVDVEYIAVSFGTDSSLTVTKGWDNVTGWGEPNGLPFIQGVTGKTTGAVKPKE